jgi:hypothetical protein
MGGITHDAVGAALVMFSIDTDKLTLAEALDSVRAEYKRIKEAALAQERMGAVNKAEDAYWAADDLAAAGREYIAGARKRFTLMTANERSEYLKRAREQAQLEADVTKAMAAWDAAKEGKAHAGNAGDGSRTSDMPALKESVPFVRSFSDRAFIIAHEKAMPAAAGIKIAGWHAFELNGEACPKHWGGLVGSSYSTLNKALTSAITGGTSPGMGGIRQATQAEIERLALL